MKELTLDDYRRVLRWAGWQRIPHEIGDAWSMPGTPYRVFESHFERDQKMMYLLLLDHSVLEKVRENPDRVIPFSRRQKFYLALDSIWQQRFNRKADSPYQAQFMDAYVLKSAPGDAVRAALAANLIGEKL